ncbi:hypothetical protein [Paucibacter sp. KCTC 42545]|uniref:hypothetical protein n=1 Tax=Paucibacter sp. KCTC 42545 TaxID=1768242 RepID=UPI000733B3B6|nr:hypothetical protein [Paucibacter sp. KCTC 42545]ALT76835.1 hypothetical protein AT984_06165 [Paucibacter sp. KCTC 42545]
MSPACVEPAISKPAASRQRPTQPDHIKVSRKAGKVPCQFDHWRSEVALRNNEDGTQSFITISPGISGIEFVRDDKAGKPTLILRDAQHEYRFEQVRKS